MLKYEELTFMVPKESGDYFESSKFVIKSIEEIIKEAILFNKNKIIII